MLLIFGDDQRGAAVLEQMTHLAPPARRIDAVGDRAERLRRQVRNGPLRARVADDGPRLARHDPVLAREPARERADTRGQLAPRRLAPDAQRLRAERDALGPRPRAPDEQARQSARAQRLEIHAGRIIPEGWFRKSWSCERRAPPAAAPRQATENAALPPPFLRVAVTRPPA